MAWWEGPVYDILKWTAKKGWEGVQEARRGMGRAEIDRQRYQNDENYRRQCDEEWKIMMQKDLW